MVAPQWIAVVGMDAHPLIVVGIQMLEVTAAQELSLVATVTRSDPENLEDTVIETKVVADGRTTTAAERGIMKVMDMMTPAANEGIDQRLVSMVCWVRPFHFQHFFPFVGG